MSKTTFLVPDYYPRFRCKGPDCRRPCCGGWPISISMEEYFRLLSVECSPALRRRLDSAFRLADSPDADRYAQICPNYVGDCPMHLGNGLCGLLHQQNGGNALREGGALNALHIGRGNGTMHRLISFQDGSGHGVIAVV